MNWAQITILVIVGVSLLLGAYQHGKEKTGTHNFWTTFISVVITLFLYYHAGLFDKLSP
jgi:uncharacterized membrane protein HdeD (DUF308 family)